jgi:hypothetical protein
MESKKCTRFAQVMAADTVLNLSSVSTLQQLTWTEIIALTCLMKIIACASMPIIIDLGRGRSLEERLRPCPSARSPKLVKSTIMLIGNIRPLPSTVEILRS